LGYAALNFSVKLIIILLAPTLSHTLFI